MTDAHKFAVAVNIRKATRDDIYFEKECLIARQIIAAAKKKAKKAKNDPR